MKSHLEKYGDAGQSCYFPCQFRRFPSNGYDGLIFGETKMTIIIGRGAGFTQVTKFNSCVIRATETGETTYSE